MAQHVIVRTLKELFSTYKHYYSLYTLKALCNQSLPFISIYYMTTILNLFLAQGFEAVQPYIIHYLAILCLLQLCLSFLNPILQEKREVIDTTITNQPYLKMQRINFHLADQSATHQDLNRISRDMFTTNSSILVISQYIEIMLGNLIILAWSVYLLMPLFRPIQAHHQLSWLTSSGINMLLLLLIGIFLYVQQIFTRKAFGYLESTRHNVSEINNIYNYFYHKLPQHESLKEVHLYQLGTYIKTMYNQQTQVISQWQKKFTTTFFKSSVLQLVFTQVILLLVYISIGAKVLLGGLAIGMVIQLAGTLREFITCLSSILDFSALFAQPDVMTRYYHFMDLPEDHAIGSIPVEKRLDNQYQLSVKDLSFTYPNSDTEILHQISQDFEIGKKYAIVGENGSGKTTFIKLLMRLYEPSKGHIYLNQINAQKYNLTEYYQLFGVVFQDFRLLNFTIAQNISVSQSYDSRQIQQILADLSMNPMLTTLPKGIDTYLGTEFDESGINLSGGQAQKIALARALYKDTPIMILDEPTAALDPRAEFDIYQNFDQMTKDKTTFYISHRLASCRFCDEILVFDQGQIIQRGTHDKLVKQAGKYQTLWHAQAQYYN